MKKETIFWPTSSHLVLSARLHILLFSVSLLTLALASKADAQADVLLNPLVRQEQKVVPSDATTGSYFGRAVAIDGSTALIGAIGDNGFQGAAYLFIETDGVWSQGQKLQASD